MTDTMREEVERVAELDMLPREAKPSPALEGRVVAALGREGLLGRRAPGWPALRVAAAAALAVTLFAAGWLAGAARGAAPTETDAAAPAVATAAPDPTHLLLLRAGTGYRPAPTPEAARERVAEYRAWAQEEFRAGRLSSGRKLGGDVRFLAEAGELRPDTDVQGLFLVAATSLDDAMQIASRCPHIRYGGTIEVRPIDAT